MNQEKFIVWFCFPNNHLHSSLLSINKMIYKNKGKRGMIMIKAMFRKEEFVFLKMQKVT